MKFLVTLTALLMLSGCSGLSMYNQVPAPIGRSGQVPSYPSTSQEAVKTYPVDEYVQDEVFRSDELLNEQNPAVLALLDSAYQQRENGHLDVAASKLERAVRISPKDGQVWHALAATRYQQKKYALAISLAKKSNLFAISNKGLQRQNWQLMAESHDRLGHPQSAKQARLNASRLF